jgi:hypothetical protein
MSRLRQIALLGAAVGVLGMVVASTGAAAQDARTAALEQRLQRESDSLAAGRFERVGDGTVAVVKRGEPSVFPIELDGGITYAVVAACGEGCGHVEIALFDPAQSQLYRSPEASDVVIMRGPARKSGVHGIVLSVPGCRAAACPVGFVLLRQTPGPADAKAVSAAPVTPQMRAPFPGSTADSEDDRALSALAELAVTARDAARAKERVAAPVVAPVATDADTAPGRPSAVKSPVASRPGASAPASCQRMADRYAAAARSAGAPGTTPELFNMYQYLQCNCGYPPSPQVPPCTR